MPLTENVVKNLKDNLDYNHGGGLHLKAEGASLIDSPILVLGLGGTGALSLIRLKQMVNERLNAGLDREKPDNIEYLAIDTDPRTKDISYGSTKFSVVNQETLIMQDASLAQSYENLVRGQHPHISSWISKNINVTQIQNGAGGIRQVGRFLFFKEMNEVKMAVENKLQKILKGRDSQKSKVFVFITVGVSGGTGSGTFIDIAYIVKKLIMEVGFTSQIIGFIFLPDVNLQDVRDGSSVRNIQRNGFAALKELDYLMNLGKDGNAEAFEQSYGSFSVASNNAPYDICHLVSSINAKGVNNYSKENCMSAAAETIINFIANEPNVTNNDFSIASYLSNIATNTGAFTTQLVTKNPIKYNYNTLGSSSGVLPMDDVLNYLTHILFDKMHNMYEVQPGKSGVENFITQMNLSFENVESMIRLNVYLDDISVYTYDHIKSNPNLIDSYLNENLETLLEIMTKNKNSFLESFKQNVKNRLEIMFQDLNMGPFYVSRLINAVDGEFCVLKYLGEIVEKRLVLEKINEAELRRRQSVINELRTKISNNNPLLGFGKEASARDYKKAYLDYYSAVLTNQVYDCMSSAFTEVYSFLNDYNNKVFEMFTSMLKILKDIFNKHAGIQNEGVIQRTEKSTEFTWNIINSSDLVTKVDLLIHNDPTFKISFNSIIQNFISELISNSAKWLDSSKSYIAEMLNDFIVKNFYSVARESIDFYIDQITNSDKDKSQQFITELFSKLTSSSEVMFPFGSMFEPSTLGFPTYEYISVPYNTQAFHTNVGTNAQIKKSVITNRIFMLNVIHAVPLAAYREMEKYEQVYESFINRNEGIGMHLYEKDDKNWSRLPSPICEECWSAGYKNLRESKNNEQTRLIFDKAMEYGYIKWDNTSNQYNCYYGEKTDINNILKQCGIESLEDVIAIPDAIKAGAMMKQILADNTRLTEMESLYDTTFHEDNSPNVNYAKGIFINMPSLNAKIRRMVEEHINILEVMDKLASIQGSQKFYSQFGAILYTNLVKKERGTYKYVDSKNLQKPMFSITDSCPDSYYEYYLFNEFMNLNDAEKLFIYTKSQDIIHTATDEEYAVIIENIGKNMSYFKEKRQLLVSDYLMIPDGAKKAEFYSIMVSEFEKAQNALA